MQRLKQPTCRAAERGRKLLEEISGKQTKTNGGEEKDRHCEENRRRHGQRKIKKPSTFSCFYSFALFSFTQARFFYQLLVILHDSTHPLDTQTFVESVEHLHILDVKFDRTESATTLRVRFPKARQLLARCTFLTCKCPPSNPNTSECRCFQP